MADDEEKRERLRTLVIEEIIQTEKVYATDLGIFFKMYCVPLQPKKEKAKNIISKEEHTHLFSNLSELLDITYSLLNTFEQRKRKLKETGGKYIVGDVFLKMADAFKAYTIYCANHPAAVLTLEKCRKDANFANFEKQQNSNPDTKGIGLAGFLIKPVQRICKYPLFFQNLMKQTPPGHPEYNHILSSQEKILAVVDYVNERQAISENSKKLQDIRDSLEGLEGLELVKPRRKFLLQMNCKKDNMDYTLFLFSDMLIYTKPKKDKYKYKGRIPIQRMRIVDVVEKDLKFPFDITDDGNAPIHSRLTMQANSEAEKKKLMSEAVRAKECFRKEAAESSTFVWTPVQKLKCKALYDHFATGTLQKESELEFCVGDIISVTEKSNTRYWKGECNGIMGVFPWEFVEVLGNDEVTVSDLVGCLIQGDKYTFESYLQTLPEDQQQAKREEVELRFKQIVEQMEVQDSSSSSQGPSLKHSGSLPSSPPRQRTPSSPRSSPIVSPRSSPSPSVVASNSPRSNPIPGQPIIKSNSFAPEEVAISASPPPIPRSFSFPNTAPPTPPTPSSPPHSRTGSKPPRPERPGKSTTSPTVSPHVSASTVAVPSLPLKRSPSPPSSTSPPPSEDETVEEPLSPSGKGLKWENRLAQRLTRSSSVDKSPTLSPKDIKLSCVKSIGQSHDQNIKFRKTMEDEMIYIDKFNGNPGQGYFAVYDGHGGRAVVEYIVAHLHEDILQRLGKNSDVPAVLKESYLAVDQQIIDAKINPSEGCTSVSAVLIKSDHGDRCLYLANIGDARAVLCRAGKAERLTMDHKASDPSEQKRVKDLGGFVVNNRIGGFLAVSRAFGDTGIKAYGLTAEPYQSTTILKSTDTHLIVACDGLWDVISDQEAVDLVKRTLSAQQASDKLLQYALEHGSTDNVSIMVVVL